MIYECHITIGLHPISAKALIESLGWKFSYITGDPDLGTDPHEYATRHASANTQITIVIEELTRIASILARQGFPILREKVELVMYDTHLHPPQPTR